MVAIILGIHFRPVGNEFNIIVDLLHNPVMLPYGRGLQLAVNMAMLH